MKKTRYRVLAAILLLAVVLSGCSTTTSSTNTPATTSPDAPSNSSAPPSASTSSAPPASPSDSASSAPVDTSKTSIVIGGSRPQTGVYAVFEQTGFGPVYRMWVEEVNAAGGIYVEEYGKQLPIELKIYDDGSDMATMLRLMERLIIEDNVDIVFPPCSTADLFAAAPLADQYGKLLIGAEGGASALKESAAKFPGFFGPVNNSDTQIPALVNVLKELNIGSAYVVFIEDLFGTEYSGALVPALTQAGIEVNKIKSIPADIGDMAPIINDAKADGAQAFILLAYPDQNFAAVGTASALGYNPDVFLLGPGGGFDFVKFMFGGPQAIEGVMSFGAWSPKSSPAAQEYFDKYMAYITDNPVEAEASIDWWGHLPYYMSLQVLQQAIERAGTLDNDKIAEIIRTEKFDTCMGEIWFDSNVLAAECFAGNIGQWQNGLYEVVDGAKRTADPIVKPAWAAP